MNPANDPEIEVALTLLYGAMVMVTIFVAVIAVVIFDRKLTEQRELEVAGKNDRSKAAELNRATKELNQATGEALAAMWRGMIYDQQVKDRENRIRWMDRLMPGLRDEPWAQRYVKQRIETGSNDMTDEELEKFEAYLKSPVYKERKLDWALSELPNV